MDNLKEFRSLIPKERSERILRDLVKKQADGEIRTEEDLREQLELQITQAEARGTVVFQVPVRPGETMDSEKYMSFFEKVKMDIEILFVEADHIESVINSQAKIAKDQSRSLQIAIGEAKSSFEQKKVRVKPGAGFTSITQESFEQGYSQLAGRAEIDYDLFKDQRNTLDTLEAEVVPIRPDARIETIGKKLTLPASKSQDVGFKLIEEDAAETTSSNLALTDIYPIENVIDGELETFWLKTTATNQPVLRNQTLNLSQITGTSGVSPAIDISNRTQTRPQTLYIKTVGFSGIYPKITYLSSLNSYKGPVCRYDNGSNCNWDYTSFYSENCINNNCSRYETVEEQIVSGTVNIKDGFGYDTGMTMTWPNASGISPGSTWRLDLQTSGDVGSKCKLELTLKRPGDINWLELDPVIDNPFILNSIEYTEPNNSTVREITAESVSVSDRIRVDFPKISAEKIFLTITQESYSYRDLVIDPKKTALNDIREIITKIPDPTVSERKAVNMPALITSYTKSPEVSEFFAELSPSPTVFNGYFYQFGLFEVSCGLDQYSEAAIAVSKSQRFKTPTMLGIQSNIEDKISLSLSGTSNGTVEFSVIKLNYDEFGSLINIQDFPLPEIVNGYITERLFLNSDLVGTLRFAASSISEVKNITTGETLSATDYSLTTSVATSPISKVEISRSGISSSTTILITYQPKYGVYLDNEKRLALEDNSLNQLSLSNLDAIITTDPVIASREVQYSDMHIRIILRRNDNDGFTTPELRDYRLLVNENDQNRFAI